MKYTRRLRASAVARSRFVEDRALQEISNGVLLGAGLESFAQRYSELLLQTAVFEIDQAETLLWKKEKLQEHHYPISENLHFVPVDFEHVSWWNELLKHGFDVRQKTFVTCTGVTLYLTQKAIREALARLKSLAKGSSVAIAFYLPVDLLEMEDRPMQQIADKGAASSGTPFISFFTTEEVYRMAEDTGFRTIQIIRTEEIRQKYFSSRNDGLTPASGEFFLIAKV